MIEEGKPHHPAPYFMRGEHSEAILQDCKFIWPERDTLYTKKVSP